MKLLDLGDNIGRFRFSQSCVGLAGCLCLSYSVWTPFWLKERGLWAEWNNTVSDQAGHKDIFNGESTFIRGLRGDHLSNTVTQGQGDALTDKQSKHVRQGLGG